MRLVWEIDEAITQPAKNQDQINIELNFDEDDPDNQGLVTITGLDLVADAVEIVNKYVADGVKGGAGVFEGLPFKLKLEAGLESLVLFDGYIDLTNPDTLFACDAINAALVEAGSVTWLEDNGENSFTFELLAKQDLTIGLADYISIPYVVSAIPNNRDIAMISLAGFVLFTQIKTVIKDITEFTPDLAAFTTAIQSFIKLALFILYLVFLILTMIQLVIDLINAIIQPIKFHAGMLLQTSLEKGAEKLGHTFESTIFDDPFWKGVVVIPAKKTIPADISDETLFGFLKPNNPIVTGYFDGTYGDLLNACKKLFYGKKLVADGVIRLENRSFNVSSGNYSLESGNPVEILKHGINANELKANYKVRFQTDQSDINTLDEIEGTIAQNITEPIVINNANMVLMKGLEEVAIPFALGKRKEDLTAPEKFFKAILKPIDAILGALIAIANAFGANLSAKPLAAGIENRIGMLKLSDDHFSQPKIISFDIDLNNPKNTKIKTNNKDRLSAEQIYRDFHFHQSFVPTDENPNGNQWKIYELPGDINICFDDFKKLRKDNLIFDPNGDIAKLQSLKFNILSETATTFIYRVNEKYTGNLKDRLFTLDGL